EIELCGNHPGAADAAKFKPSPEDIRRDVTYFAKLSLELRPADRKNLISYVEYHAERFLQTYRMIPQAAPGDRLLDIAAFFPFTFALYKNKGYEQVRSTCYRRSGATATNYYQEVKDPKFDRVIKICSEVLDLDVDTFPYPDGYFATVLCLETLEHLSRDPMWMMSQINRVMRVGGTLILTTPNVLSAYNLEEFLAGRHPNGANKYSRSGVPAVRHNREYTPEEVRILLALSGFE